MTPIEAIQGKYGYKILTGTAETDLSSLIIVGVVIRSPGATLAKLEIDDVDVRTARGLTGEALDVTDPPIFAGYNTFKGSKGSKTFSKIQLTSASDSVALIFGE